MRVPGCGPRVPNRSTPAWPARRYRRQPVAAQQRQGDPGRGRRPQHVARAAPAVHLLGERGQLGRVEPVTDQQVATISVLDPVPAQHRPQPADQHGQLVLGLGRRRVAPQRVDQHVGRHDLALGQGQCAERQPALPAAQGLRLDAVHAEVAQHPQRQRLHAGIKPQRNHPPPYRSRRKEAATGSGQAGRRSIRKTTSRRHP